MKISKKALIEKRKKKKNVFLITGGTGFIGSHTTIALIKAGYSVVLLCRPKNGKSAQERVNQLLNWFQITKPEELSRIEVIEGFLSKEGLGVSKKIYLYLSGTIDEIIHCAAYTSFSEKKREELEIANIKTLENLLKLAVFPDSKCYFLHLISSVYAAGKKTGVFKESIIETKEFYNAYEETKYLGEKYVSKIFKQKGIRVTIYRSSIVYGDSNSGRSTLFNAVYYPVKMALFLKNIYQEDINLRGGEKAGQMGVYINNDGTVNLPIRMVNRTGGTMNLIPVNYFTEAFIGLLENCLDDNIFHIINEYPKTLDDIISYFQKLFKIRGIRSVPKEIISETSYNSLEILFNSFLKMYGPYISDIRQFDNYKSGVILKKKNISCPEFDYGVFKKCMNYAISVNWQNPWEKKK